MLAIRHLFCVAARWVATLALFAALPAAAAETVNAYSIWPEDPEMPIPVGWREPSEPCRGSKETCLEYIGRVWTDMRPLSLRNRTTS